MTHQQAQDIKTFLFAILLALFVAGLLTAAMTSPNKPRLLVGYGCEGSNGQPMYYTEEDHFPPCSLIEDAR